MAAAATSPSEEALWWYKEDGETNGPISASDLRKLGLHPNTFVWREDFGDRWKRYDQTELAGTPGAPLPVMPPPLVSPSTSYNPKWEPTFAKFDKAEGFHYTRSIWALIFGVFYYFYLRMWRKGFIILGFSIWVGLLLTILEKTAGLPDLSKYVGLGANGLCMIFAERDYYLWKRKGETVWPSLNGLSNAWVLGAFVILPLVALMAVAAISEDDQPSRAASVQERLSEAHAASVAPTATAFEPTPSVPSIVRKHLDPSEEREAERQRAEKACAQRLQQTWGGTARNRYDEKTVYRFQVEVRGGVLATNEILFGGHKFMDISASLYKYINGDLADVGELPVHYCVLSDDLEVIGMETSVEAGLR